MTSPALTRYFQIRQNEEDAKKLHELQQTSLFNEKTFYRAFVKDLLTAKKEVIIYSPFVTKYRSEYFKRTLTTLKRRNIAVFIFTRPIEEHDLMMKNEVSCALRDYEALGTSIMYLPGQIHEKAAIIDREILWEGSLNILSQRQSREMMRRIPDETSAKHVLSYLGLTMKLAEGYKLQYERLYRSLVTNSDRTVLKKKLFWIGIIVVFLGLWLLTNIKIIMVASNGAVGLLRVFSR